LICIWAGGWYVRPGIIAAERYEMMTAMGWNETSSGFLNLTVRVYFVLLLAPVNPYLTTCSETFEEQEMLQE
jgi:hypothetical protein